MVDDTESGRPRDFAHRETASDAPKAEEKAVFNPKGIGSNVFLTAAAAVVPLVIVGVAGVKTILGARKPKR